MEAQTLTDFSIIGGGKSSAEEYSGVATVSQAAAEGLYEKNREGLQKPTWVLVRYVPPPIRRF
jgi:ribosomal silencing factor RsfS